MPKGNILIVEDESVVGLDIAVSLNRLGYAVTGQSAGGGASIWVTVSLGVAEIREGLEDLDSLLKDADQALYAAKAAGRNRVFVWRTER